MKITTILKCTLFAAMSFNVNAIGIDSAANSVDSKQQKKTKPMPTADFKAQRENINMVRKERIKIYREHHKVVMKERQQSMALDKNEKHKLITEKVRARVAKN